jgi:glycosyltransferase involved in cell wall biosynthesis
MLGTASTPIQSVLICTKDRAESVRAVLGTLCEQSLTPDEVLVVDSSADLDTSKLISEYTGVPFSLRHVSARPGLTHQRNIALAEVQKRTTIVHFLDDDVLLEADYIAAICREFEIDGSVAGVGGRVVNSPTASFGPLWRAIGMQGAPGSLLRNGVNTQCLSGSRRRVEWLSGCSMSFRLSAMDGLLFDEGREGYGLGEDVDFSARAAKRGALIWTPDARLVHNQAPQGRLAQRRLAADQAAHRFRLARRGVGGVAHSAVILHAPVVSMAYVAIGVRARSLSTVMCGYDYAHGMVKSVLHHEY